MEKSKNLKNSNEGLNKNSIPCINFEKCLGKWFKYKYKDDYGFCKICIKKEKMPGISKDYHGNLLFNCKGTC